MIDIIRSRFPEHNWQHMDMRALDFRNTFDGIIAWHSFFHLKTSNQKETLEKFAQHLSSGGVLMFTIGFKEGEAIGNIGGEAVYHASLSAEVYRELLNDLGMNVIDIVLNDTTCGGASIVLARKE